MYRYGHKKRKYLFWGKLNMCFLKRMTTIFFADLKPEHIFNKILSYLRISFFIFQTTGSNFLRYSSYIWLRDRFPSRYLQRIIEHNRLALNMIALNWLDKYWLFCMGYHAGCFGECNLRLRASKPKTMLHLICITLYNVHNRVLCSSRKKNYYSCFRLLWLQVLSHLKDIKPLDVTPYPQNEHTNLFYSLQVKLSIYNRSLDALDLEFQPMFVTWEVLKSTHTQKEYLLFGLSILE